MEDKFLINVIAKRYNISRSTLIYYDNIGVLSPTHYDKNNYRYYGREDMEKLEVILTLKESGLPLKLIKKFIKSPSHSSSIDILKKQKDNISKKIKELEESDYIVVLFYGPLNKNLIMKNMEKLIREVQEKEYKINGDCYVVPLIDSWATLEEEEYINEMLIPIKKN